MKNEQCAALVRAVDMLGRALAELARISERADERRRQDLVAQRRVLANETAKVGDLASVFFEALGDPALLSKYRNLFSAARSKAAIHQANWSAVRAVDDEYRASAREAGEAYRLLSVWLRGVIADIAKRPETP